MSGCVVRVALQLAAYATTYAPTGFVQVACCLPAAKLHMETPCMVCLAPKLTGESAYRMPQPL
jgi:hypothetical protein